MNDVPPSHQKHAFFVLFLIGIFLAMLAAGVLAIPSWVAFWSNPTALHQWVARTGPTAPLIIIGYEARQVIIPPLPGEALDIANGYLFGPWRGAVYSLIGIMAGSVVALWLSRKFGRRIIQKMWPNITSRTIDRYLGFKHWWLWLILLVTPGAPDDAISYLLGLTSIPFGWARLLIFLGRPPKVIVTSLLGAKFSQGSPLIIVGTTSILAVGLFLLGRYQERRAVDKGQTS